tara:strand:- start:337 stop:1275 length:939 start_codon:yes stop_codon:yes gene_type:complete
MSTLRLKSRRREDQGSKWGRILIAILATIGVIDTGSITLKRFGFLGSLTCPGGNQGCDQVLNSPWGSIPFGESLIPLSSIGLLSYLIVLLFAIIPFLSGLFKKKNNLYRPTWWGLFIISTCMFIFSGLLMILMVYKIQAFCFFCVLSALISTLILVITILNGGWENPRELIFRGFIISIIVILSGLIWSSSVDPSKQELTTAEIGIAPPIKSISSSSSISLAKHLTANKIVLFNAWWCPHCHDQKELFGKEAVNELMLIECASDGKNNQADLCKKKGITGFPSWEINGQLESGVKSLKELAEISGYKGSTDF